MWSALTVLAIILGAPPPSASADAPAATPACAVGAAKIRELTAGETRILSDRPAEVYSGDLPSSVPAEMRAVWNRRAPTNLFTACPELRGLLPATFTFASENDWTALRPVKTPNPRPATPITILSAPVLSRDGKTAIKVETTLCRALCGTAFLITLRLDGGVWKSVGGQILAIS